MAKVGDRLPAVKLNEFLKLEVEGCALGMNTVDIQQASAGKTIAFFALPGAFTPTCDQSHLPGYLAQADAIKAAGADEIWCVSVNDAFVMSAWGEHQGVGRSIRLLADGDAELAKALDLVFDLSGKGFGLRFQRMSMVIVDSVIKSLQVEPAGGLTVSSAEAMLEQLKNLA
jgi:peroxiredoxin